MVEADGGEPGRTTSGIALREEPDRSVVELWGEVDLAVRQGAGPVCQAVSARALPLVIDATGVTFVDSAGMSVLVRLARDAETHHYPVELRHAPWTLRELLTITGVDRLLPITDDDDGAPPSDRR